MSLLSKASIVLTPNAVKESKLYSIIPSNGNGDMTVVRATTATKVNNLGLIENVALNVPRLNYIAAGGCPSILLEPQRTNLLTYSEDFSNIAWTKASCLITSNTVISPSGLSNSFTYTGNGVSGSHFLYSTASIISGTSYAFTVYAKKGSNNYFQLIGSVSPFGSNVWANFDLNAGTVGSVGTLSSASIEQVNNGWYRCRLIGTAVATVNSSAFIINIINSSTDTRAQSNALSTNFYLWGAQLEQGAYATSYIPTVASTVTRNNDKLSRSNIYTNGLITSAGGNWFVELNNNFNLKSDADAFGLYIGDSSSTPINSFGIRTVSTGRFGINKRISNVFTELYTTLTDNVKILFKWNGVTADIFVNGIKVVVSTAFTATALEYLINSGESTPKYIKSQMLFSTPLSDAECVQLTTL